MTDVMKAPKRFIDKKRALRHIVHSAIRLIFMGEDPFAIHLLVQSADKIATDLMRLAGMSDPFDIDYLIAPGKKNEFYAKYRATYNYLKHADKDASEKLAVRDIVQSNDLMAFGCAIRYEKLFGEITSHITQFKVLITLCYPEIVRWEIVRGGRQSLDEAIIGLSRGDLLQAFIESLSQDEAYIKERAEDLVDVLQARRRMLDGRSQPASLVV